MWKDEPADTDIHPLEGIIDEIRISDETLAGLLFDVAALAVRLKKPLHARLMPIPGKVAGDPVQFDFPYFTESRVLPLDGDEAPGLLTGLFRKFHTCLPPRYV